MIPKYLLPKTTPSSSGSLNPLFLFPDGIRLGDIPPNQPLSEAQRLRLVKGCKSRTAQEVLDEAHRKVTFQHQSLLLKYCEPSIDCAEVKEQPAYKREEVKHGTTGCQTVIEFKHWQDAWRVRTQVECTSGKLPLQEGARVSDMLSSRGANKIAESCEFMHLKKGGFKTFVTGTFNSDVRKDIEAGRTTIQKEVSRTMNALQKMYQRGWSKKDGSKVNGHDDGLPYLWVVEVPENENGEPNPHIHMLLGWRVDYQDFSEWAERIENIWGNGYFHLEKIKDSACVGAYMAKAAGYLCKAQDKDNQGKVEGNRYGISKTARAPGWLVCSRDQLHIMGQLIYDVYDHLTVKHGDKYRERKALNTQLSQTPKTNKKQRAAIGQRLAKVRQDINDIPIRCNKYQVVLKSSLAAALFFGWLQTESAHMNTPDWLPIKPEGAVWQPGEKYTAKQNQHITRLKYRFSEQRFWRRLTNVPDWTLTTDWYWRYVKHDYQHIHHQHEERLAQHDAPTLEQLTDYGFI